MSTDMQKINWPGWETIRLIGRGSFGAVYEIQRSIFGDVEKAALKVISIPQNASDIDEMYSDGYDEESITSTFKSHLKSIVAEYSLMRKMNGSSNIVNCDDVRYVQHNDGIGWDIFIKMELLTPLTKVLPAEIPEETVIKIAKDMCAALELCKKHEIVHRDIKPQNIFMSPNGDYKLGDFGIAKTVEKTMGGTKIGTYKYMAPEVYNNQPYGTAADIYSLGLVLYYMLNERRMPFLPLPPEKLKAGMEEKARLRRFSGEQLPPPAHGSEKLKRIVLKACAYDPKDRYQSALEMLAVLENMEEYVDTEETIYMSSASCKNLTDKEHIRKEQEERDRYREDQQEKECMNGKQGDSSKNKKRVRVVAGIAMMVFASVLLGMLIARFTGGKNTFDKTEITSTASIDNSFSQNEVINVHTHSWIDATCTTPKTCYTCGQVSGTAKGHQWIDATYDAPKLCFACGATEGMPLEVPSQTESSSGLAIPIQGKIAAGNYHSVLLSADGTVIATGSTDLNDTSNKGTRLDVSSWTDIVEISASSHTVGLRSDGTVVACGINQYGQCEVSSWTDIVSVRAGNNHTVGLRSDGTVVATGKNSHGQCDVSHWEGVVAIAVSENETYGLKDNGSIISAGRYTYGSAWKDIENIAAGTYDFYGLKKDGTVVGAGNNKKWDDNTISSWTNIVEISASSTHVVGLMENGRVVACGRTSAAEACNVDSWTNIVQVSAGMNFTIGLTADGRVLFLGENRHGQCNLS